MSALPHPMLLTPRSPPVAEGIDLRCCSCADPEWLEAAQGAAICVADPPWMYDRQVGAGVAAEHYGGLPVPTIVEHLQAIGAPCLVVWCTWPLLGEWVQHHGPLGTLKTGGAWSKSEGRSGHYGPGHWWAGCSEPVLVYGRAETDRAQPLRNAWLEPPAQHSRKPVLWMRAWLRRWTRPGDLVVDPYAGLGSVAEACLLEGRRYLGAEIDPERHAAALSLLAQARP